MNIDNNGKLRGLTGQVLFSEKDLSSNVLIATIMPLYRLSFRYGVWEEDLSVETVVSRLENNFSGNYQGFFLYDEGEICIGASWFEYVDPDWLVKNKYPKLGVFAKEKIEENKLSKCVWQAETMVHPRYQNQGIATKLKAEIDFSLQSISKKSGGVFACTRLREDNIHIISINKKFGFMQTGIKVPCSLKLDTNHEFWYKIF